MCAACWSASMKRFLKFFLDVRPRQLKILTKGSLTYDVPSLA
jgi:hypothetical protein